MEQTLVVWYVGATALGLLFSYLIVVIYRRVVPVDASRRYWSEVAKGVHGLLVGEIDDFWSEYRRIITGTAAFVARQLAGIVLAFAPLVIALLMAGPIVFAQWDEGAARTAIPESAGRLNAGPAGALEQSYVLRDGPGIALPARPGAIALCEPGSLACLVLTGFGFSTITVAELGRGEPGVIVIRTMHDDWNPLWPYLSDPEFIFFVALSLGSLLLLLRRRPARAGVPSDYPISLVDYLLTQAAIGAPRLMHRLGDCEARLFRRRIAGIEVTEPVFIAGLARSGSTILLEKLAAIEGVATHRYRDFPFIMTPIFWNRFLNLFGTAQSPIERPHQDRIQITRDSPDAFEEPIWQHHFPWVHDPDRLHRLTSDAADSGFSAFYREHIQKILSIRKGNRYLSKGNYNLPRIELIGSLFPDARFLIPVRHPLPHIESLVRQHRLFTEYSARDPKVPTYLRAVGHYEFGPQRLPISLRERGAREISAAWEQGKELLGYARQWADVYGFVADLRRTDPALAGRIRIVRFEDLCADPERELTAILRFTHLDSRATVSTLAAGISAPARRVELPEGEIESCWQAVAAVADQYGYRRDAY